MKKIIVIAILMALTLCGYSQRVDTYLVQSPSGQLTVVRDKKMDSLIQVAIRETMDSLRSQRYIAKITAVPEWRRKSRALENTYAKSIYTKPKKLSLQR